MCAGSFPCPINTTEIYIILLCKINPLPHRDTFANTADPDQAAFPGAA